MDIIERDIYSCICQNDGVKAREIANFIKADKSRINHYLYTSPLMRDLCFCDKEYRWHGLIRQSFPHRGLEDFCGYYSKAEEFLEMQEGEWMDRLLPGCRQIGRNLNNSRGLFHSFLNARQVMTDLFKDLYGIDFHDWEVAFELRIKKSRMIRIYTDVLVITPFYVFAMEFKMHDEIRQEDVAQAAKYVEYLEVIFGAKYDVIPVLVLTGATDLFSYVCLTDSTAQVPVCSGDMLFNIFDEYIGFLKD